MLRTHRLTAAALALVMGAPLAVAPAAARASEEGRRNTALALGAAAVGLLLTQRDKTAGIVAGLGAAYAYKRYNDSVNDRHRWDRYGYNDRHGYNDRYDGRNNDRYSNRYDGRNTDRYGSDGYYRTNDRRDGSRYDMHRSERDRGSSRYGR